MLSGNAAKKLHTSQVVAYHYDTWSRLTNRTLSNRVSTVYHYDGYGGVSNIIHYQTAQEQKVISGFTYTYNQDGSIRQRARIGGLNQQAVEQYGYDDDNNLKDYQCSGTLCPRDAQGKVINYQHYTFGGFNNIKTVASNNTLTTYAYDQQIPTRLIDYHNSNPAYPSSQKLRYDRNGNILQDDQGNVITYNPLDQTRSVGTQQGITTYFYNREGQQVGEDIPSGQTTYFMYGQNNLLNTRVGSQQTSFLYGANRLGKQDNEGAQYYLTDQGGSVVNTINPTQEQAQKITSYAYSPYGIESDLTKQASNTAPTQHFGFDGQLTDSQTNWQFLGQGYRAYNPMLHRFMSQDSLSPFDKGGINGYIFGSNNPIMMSDPTGHMSFWANMGIGLVMGMAAGMLTSEMGGWGALAINALAGAVGSNIDAIDNGAHGKAINWKSVGINAGIGAVLGILDTSIIQGRTVEREAISPYHYAPEYKLKGMHFINGYLKDYFYNVKYFSLTSRQDFEIIVNEGKLFYRNTNRILDTAGEKYMYVMSGRGEIYIARKVPGEIQHSSFLGGQRVAAAGRIQVENGRIIQFDYHSGHYRTTMRHFLQFQDRLASLRSILPS